RRWSSGFAWNNPDEDLSGYDGYFFRDDLLRIQQFLSQYDDIDRWSSSENAPEWLTDLFPKKHDRILAKKLISRKRMIKDPYEQFLLKEAAERSAKVHAALAKNRFEAKPHENFWHADWITYGAQYNLSKQAYQPIIAGGPRACCLHYHGKTMPLNQDRYILIDAAFEYEGYTADITRVYFWKANAWDRIVYEGLLSVQKRMIEASVEGTSLPNLQIQTQYLIAELLQEWGWAQGSLEKIVVEDVAQYYPHRIGHPLGIDVHDLCDDRGLVDEPLQNGAVITIEPGIYIDPTLFPETHPAYGLGLRIEDDVLIHHNQPIVLSQLAPKEWKDVGA
ncbi:MAG: M24 family metallopeptidase, partial [Gammaproteobacteria bacterium]|nr:M24 family metallopeptidase [Gammaproteobacteria bacterium]